MTFPAFDKALDHLKKSSDPIGEIMRTSAYLFPMQWLYVKMCQEVVNLETKEKALKWISETDAETKNKYWILVKEKDWPRYKKIWAMQAVYCFDNLK